MRLATDQLADDGVTRLISTVEWTNFASLRSFEQMNFSRLGRLWMLGRGERRWYTPPKGGKNAWRSLWSRRCGRAARSCYA
jgi:hypothetical protein